MDKKKKIVIYGAGDQGRVVLKILRDLKVWDVAGFVDAQIKEGTVIDGVEVIGKEKVLKMKSVPYAFVGIGDNKARKKVFNELKKTGVQFPSLVHPSAVVPSDVSLGEGTVVCPGVIIWTKACIGENCIINTGAILEHDNVLEDHVHVASGAKFGGRVHIKSESLIGTGAVVLPYITVGGNAVVGAGSVVTKNVPDGATVAGVPARIIKKGRE